MKSNNKYKHGFKAPEGYLENFEDALFTKINSKELPHATGQTVPEGYFDQLEDTLFTKLNLHEKPNKVLPLFAKKNLHYVLAVAASLVLVVTLVTKKTMPSIETIELASIEQYLEEGNIEWTGNDVAAPFAETDLDAVSISSDLLSEELLESYLIENIEDATLLIE